MNDSILQQDPTLSEIINSDRELYEEIALSFTELYNIPIKIFDKRGEKIIDSRPQSRLCHYIFSVQPFGVDCLQVTPKSQQKIPDVGTIEIQSCFIGFEYRTFPFCLDTERIGKIVFGPFNPKEYSSIPQSVLELSSEISPDLANHYFNEYGRMDSLLAEEIVKHLATVFETMAYLAYKSKLTTHIHVESITEAFEELTRKDLRIENSDQLLSSLNHLKSRILTKLVNAFEQPVSTMMSYAEMLLEGIGGKLNPSHTEFVSMIVEQGNKVFQLLDELKELSRVEQGRLQLNKEKVSLEVLLMNALKAVKPSAKRKKVRARLHKPAELPNVNVDILKITTAINNILENAIFYTVPESEIKIFIETGKKGEPSIFGTSVPGKYVDIKISDSGPGLTSEQMMNVFEAFYQVEGSNNEDRLGLGLTIAKCYVDSHLGEIRLQSKDGEGSVFTIRLPIEEVE